MTTKLLISLLGALALGCGHLDDGIDDDRCDDPRDEGVALVTITPTPGARFAIGAASAKVSGTAEHTLGLAIRRITVAGLDATSDSFNFGAWSIDVPAHAIASRLPANPSLPAEVSLDVVGYDACSDGAAATTTAVAVTVEAPTP